MVAPYRNCIRPNNGLQSVLSQPMSHARPNNLLCRCARRLEITMLTFSQDCDTYSRVRACGLNQSVWLRSWSTGPTAWMMVKLHRYVIPKTDWFH
ncbi:hypothetical protein PoB_004134600 [Plakobranchus ocellatus]|uniref:Uncharacterized protein n=1 Tax=Plakobranchus ocellatus TaxID=259542 RepID=A0AAV4B2U3_9GAST|nr:hypothetical protein PoB_004134600 [Plakobranchus ocellatus]